MAGLLSPLNARSGAAIQGRVASAAPAGTSWRPIPAQEVQGCTTASPWPPEPAQRAQGRVRPRSVDAGSFVAPWHFGQLRLPVPLQYSQGRVPLIGLPWHASQGLCPVAPIPTASLDPR